MPDAPVELDELVDLKMLPAWVNEPTPGDRYAAHEGEDQGDRHRRNRRPRDKRRPEGKGPREFERPTSKERRPERPGRHDRRPSRADDRVRKNRHHRPFDKPLPPIAVKFLPRVTAFENVVAQIRSSTVAYSLFALARLFLEKATRHDVKLIAPADSPLFQLGENGAVSVDRQFLARNAFRFSKGDFYKIDITEAEPIKGNFTNVARDRWSGTLLGPTNHHDYQRRLRSLYEQRFSRRMSFADYQRQIQIITDPAEIEKWKEEARKVTTYSTLQEEPPQTFASLAEAERHFEKHYLPNLVRSVPELVVDGPASRHMHDRVLNKVIENEWNRETKSPSPMMQELAACFREAGLHVFRHRRGMLFVSSIYPRAFTSEQTAVSSQVRTIVEAIAAQPRIGRKELADKLIVDLAGEEAERAKLALASDLLWLTSAGHVIEFNDGSLDLPRAKVKPKESVDAKETQEVVAAAVSAPEKEAHADAGSPPRQERVEEAVSVAVKEAPAGGGALPTNEAPLELKETNDFVAAAISATEPQKQALGTSASTTQEPTEIGGS